MAITAERLQDRSFRSTTWQRILLNKKERHSTYSGISCWAVWAGTAPPLHTTGSDIVPEPIDREYHVCPQALFGETHHPGREQRLPELLPGLFHSRGLHQNSSRTGMNNFFKVRNPRWIKLHEKPLRQFQKPLFRKKYDWNIHTGAKN